MSGLYIHIPFCKKKCLYCDFYTGGSRIADWTKFVECITRELSSRIKELSSPFETLYIGGGTPSLIPIKDFISLVENVKKLTCKDSFREFTLEVNPEDVNKNKIETWKKSGVNRVSVGVQSLNDTELATIGRHHKSSEAKNAIDILKKEIGNISVDLMFGLPGQSLESYKETVEGIIRLKPTHISSYSLMLEEGTAMTLLVKNENIKLPDEDEWLKMSETTIQSLRDAGYVRYEISNYALPGYESVHNTFYWEGKPYLGLGPGAHSYDGNKIRRANPNDIKGYYSFFSDRKEYGAPKSQFYTEEVLNEEELREEYIMTRLRTSKGLNLLDFEKIFGKKDAEILIKKTGKYLNSGFLKKFNDNLSFTDKGFRISDSIISSLF